MSFFDQINDDDDGDDKQWKAVRRACWTL